MSELAVIDTNIFIGACLGIGAASDVIRAAIQDVYVPVFGSALYHEYEDVMGRDALFEHSRLTRKERFELLDVFLSHSQWTRVYFGWHPNLPDEGDNHLIELAVAAGASHVVTKNIRHIARMELKFDQFKIVTPQAFLKERTP